MDKPDASELLNELAPKTEYAQFIEIWPQVKHALERKVRRNAIYEKLKLAGLLTISYVTFTRFVRKCLEEEGVAAPPPRKPWPAPKAAVTPENPQAEPKPDNTPHDKVDEIATTAATALRDVITQNAGKNYAKNVRKRD